MFLPEAQMTCVTKITLDTVYFAWDSKRGKIKMTDMPAQLLGFCILIS